MVIEINFGELLLLPHFSINSLLHNIAAGSVTWLNIWLFISVKGETNYGAQKLRAIQHMILFLELAWIFLPLLFSNTRVKSKLQPKIGNVQLQKTHGVSSTNSKLPFLILYVLLIISSLVGQEN
jgi:hypothetical protein